MSQTQNVEKFVSSREGAALLGVERQSFFYYANSRNVTKRESVSGGKEHFEYKYSDLLSIKNEIQKRIQEKKCEKKQKRPHYQLKRTY